jgi:hypothetical protein
MLVCFSFVLGLVNNKFDLIKATCSIILVLYYQVEPDRVEHHTCWALCLTPKYFTNIILARDRGPRIFHRANSDEEYMLDNTS